MRHFAGGDSAPQTSLRPSPDEPRGAPALLTRSYRYPFTTASIATSRASNGSS